MEAGSGEMRSGVMMGGGGKVMCGVSPRGDLVRGRDLDWEAGEPLDRVCGIGVPGLFPSVVVDDDADDDDDKGDDLQSQNGK